MTLNVETPPKDEKAFTELGRDLLEAAIKLGLNVDPEGFLYAWAGGTRVLVDRDDESGEITSILLMAAGKRWLDSATKASVMLVAGDREKMLKFAHTIAKGIGAVSIYVEEEEPIEKTDTFIRYGVVETPLE